MARDDDLISVGFFRNDTDRPMVLYLEMLAEEVHLSPGDAVELLAVADPDLLPLTIDMVDDGLQIHAHKAIDPRWHVRFEGRLIPAGWPTKLRE
ncbi:MAG: hypothetical protein EOP37_11360 [Rubrivivax sp.]|nr:MAG: hypothetical protein EOP37_11360 [Rubrivivax sp.]